METASQTVKLGDIGVFVVRVGAGRTRSRPYVIRPMTSGAPPGIRMELAPSAAAGSPITSAADGGRRDASGERRTPRGPSISLRCGSRVRARGGTERGGEHHRGSAGLGDSKGDPGVDGDRLHGRCSR
jgi:hypothetical protein